MRTGGFIYAIGAEGSPHVKIGHTRTAVKKRLRALQIGHPSRLHILATVPVDDHLARIEKQIHRFLADQQQQGEWFAVQVDQDQLEALIMRAVQCLADEKSRKIAEDAERLAAQHATHAMASIPVFGQRVKRMRERRGLSVQELAERATTT